MVFLLSSPLCHFSYSPLFDPTFTFAYKIGPFTCFLCHVANKYRYLLLKIQFNTIFTHKK